MPAASEISVERPALQVLQLALRLRWAPLNPRHLLEFLTHPFNPLPGYLRYQLADAVAEQPGVGRVPKWCEALAEALEQAKKYRGEDDEEPIQQKLNRLIEAWIQIERFDTGTGVLSILWPPLRSGCKKSGSPAGCHQRGSQPPVPSPRRLRPGVRTRGNPQARGASECATTREAFASRSRASGIPDGETENELGAAPCYHDPGALIEPADEVYWWGFESAGSPKSAPWTRRERQGLAARGVFLQTAAILHAAQRRPRPFCRFSRHARSCASFCRRVVEANVAIIIYGDIVDRGGTAVAVHHAEADCVMVQHRSENTPHGAFLAPYLAR